MPTLPISQLPNSDRLKASDILVTVQDGVTKQANMKNTYDGVFLQNYVGSFYHTASMLNAGINAVNSMSFSTVDFARGIVVQGSRSTDIYIQNSGSYDIQFSAQIDRSIGGGSGYNVYIWLKKNGANVPQSNTVITLPGGNGDKGIAAWNWFVSASAGDTYQIAWASSEANARIVYDPTPAVGPEVPSVILTVDRVG